MLFLGMVIGATGGVWFYANYVAEPQTVINHQNDVKQKVKGSNNGVQYQDDHDIELSSKPKRNRK